AGAVACGRALRALPWPARCRTARRPRRGEPLRRCAPRRSPPGSVPPARRTQRGTECVPSPPGRASPRKPWAGGSPFRSWGAQRREEVDEREHEHPDEVDETPVQAERLDLTFIDPAAQVPDEDREDVREADQAGEG